MYHRLLNIFIATEDHHLELLLRDIPPQKQFSHKFFLHSNFDGIDLKKYAVLIIDFETFKPDLMAKVQAEKDERAVVIGCFTAGNFSALAENYHLLDWVWTKPFSPDKIRCSFANVLRYRKEREDAVLNQKYLDTLIDNLPDLIWFKDARGSHLKVNHSFCQAVNKTKSQIEGRGHYYVWDLDPDEYANGEYVCLESEEIVLNKKETCLFDETVKCGTELRKFKTFKSPIFDADGTVIGTVGFAHDVTDLQNLIVELNILIESLPFAVLVTDKNRNITTANQRFVDTFMQDREELVGKNADFLMNVTKTLFKSKRWIIERDEEGILLLSEKSVLRVHEEKLLDVFRVLAGYIYLYMDITLEQQRKNALLIDANTDYLTKLNNRRSLQDFMRKTPCLPNTVLFLADLDNFKEVNDRLGHPEGDKVLVAFSNLLKQLFSSENLFRLGGDEFGILLHHIEDKKTLKNYAEQLLSDFKEKVATRFSDVKISLSIGIAINSCQSSDFGTLFKRADMALYESKKSGKNAFTFWDGYGDISSEGI